MTKNTYYVSATIEGYDIGCEVRAENIFDAAVVFSRDVKIVFGKQPKISEVEEVAHDK